MSIGSEPDTQEMERALEDFDITHPLWSEDFHGLQAYMRSRCPVLHSPHQGGYYVLTRHADIMNVLHDPETYSSAGGVFVSPLPGNQQLIPTDADPPLHSEYRRITDKFFSAPRVARLKDKIQETADELIDGFIERGECDVYHDFTQPLTTRIFLRHILDVHGSQEAAANQQVERAMSSETADEVEDGFNGLKQWASDLIDERVAEPHGDDFINGLIHETVSGRPLTRDEQVSILMSVTIGGLETTSSVVAYGVVLLLENPNVQQRLRTDPDVFTTGIEELVRLASPTGLMRTVTQDTELGGKKLAEGDRVLIIFPAANRDPEQFPSPDEFRLDRTNANASLSFGSGNHRCVGMILARTTIRAAISRLLARTTNWELQETVSYTATQIRSPKAVALSFDRIPTEC